MQEIAITAGAIPGFNSRLQTAYRYAQSRGLWANTYAMSTWKEYFAEGVQSYFHVNNYANPPDGIHNHVNTREKLRTYDPTLYALVKEVFPCGNFIKDRCDKSGMQNLTLSSAPPKAILPFFSFTLNFSLVAVQSSIIAKSDTNC